MWPKIDKRLVLGLLLGFLYKNRIQFELSKRYFIYSILNSCRLSLLILSLCLFSICLSIFRLSYFFLEYHIQKWRRSRSILRVMIRRKSDSFEAKRLKRNLLAFCHWFGFSSTSERHYLVVTMLPTSFDLVYMSPVYVQLYSIVPV